MYKNPMMANGIKRITMLNLKLLLKWIGDPTANLYSRGAQVSSKGSKFHNIKTVPPPAAINVKIIIIDMFFPFIMYPFFKTL